MSKRKYLPTLAELIDRLSIVQLKEVFIPDNKAEYAQEIKEIVHDIDVILSDKSTTNVTLVDDACSTQLVEDVTHSSTSPIDGEAIRAIIVCAQMNLHIWHNEANYRKGIKDGNDLELTHGLNGIRATAKNKIQEKVGGRKDYKVDCLAAEFKDWDISW